MDSRPSLSAITLIRPYAARSAPSRAAGHSGRDLVEYLAYLRLAPRGGHLPVHHQALRHVRHVVVVYADVDPRLTLARASSSTSSPLSSRTVCSSNFMYISKPMASMWRLLAAEQVASPADLEVEGGNPEPLRGR